MEIELMITIPLRISDEDIDNIMVTALEGGINYWCDDVLPTSNGRMLMKSKDLYASDLISRNESLTLHDSEDDKLYTLTKDMVLKGIKLAVTRGYIRPTELYEKYTLDVGNIDAIGADSIIQLAIFDDVIYG